MDKEFKKILSKTLAQIQVGEIRKATIKSLVTFYNKQYAEWSRLSGVKLGFFIAILRLQQGEQSERISLPRHYITTPTQARRYLEEHGVRTENLYGVPLKKFSKEYINKHIKPIVNVLTQQRAMDPDDVVGRNSLRNRAEMEVRYFEHQENIKDLKNEGHRLVIASSHADCSERCAPWQGRVFSLDHTSGTTDDGRKFVPLEMATDVYYTTKKGKTYKNGLLGFNCRHYLVPYKSGFRFPKPNVAEERKQYEITKRQRELERQVIKWKIEAITNKGIDQDRYKFARSKVVEWNNAYIDFSKRHNRAYYPSRTKVI